MSHRAYQNTQRITEEPRSSEYRLFGQVTGALLDVQKQGARGGPLVDAIDWNKRFGIQQTFTHLKLGGEQK